MKLAEESMAELMDKIIRTEPDEDDLNDHISLRHQRHNALLQEPTSWIRHLYTESLDPEWQRQYKGKKAQEPKTLLGYWLAGKDLEYLTPPSVPSDTDPRSNGNWDKKEHAPERVRNRYALDDVDKADVRHTSDSYLANWWSERLDFFMTVTQQTTIPQIPSGQRSIDDLLHNPDVWDMSLSERQTLAGYWTNQARDHAYSSRTQEFKELKKRYSEACTTWTQITEKAKLEVLSKAELIGCTTNGAAKLTELLARAVPKVLLVEEAGQVLEAHILASLVPSIGHMILIGDPLQLRPTLENYELSVDNKRTGHIYRFDRSLMERLSDMGLKMSRLDVQRRMRSRISELIRTTLYPALEDHDVVQQYPSVRGMAKDVFFLDHRHPEGGGDDDPESVSKVNMFEVKMIKDLVLYFLRQGKYSNQGDIVVLCAYLGQLSQIRKTLSNEVATVIDERDAALLVDEEDAPVDTHTDTAASQGNVSSRVLLRTVDNFQGEEGTIVILSLVRNSGGSPSQGRGIGFLKSANRANVALSRAREGLYILGNADDLCRPKDCYFWRGVVEELKAHNQIGPAIPVACNLHPQTMSYISKPGQLPLRAPDGGCTLPCNHRLSCGHRCPLKCHSYDILHTVTICPVPCERLCPRDHSCNKLCYQKCGKCDVPMSIKLPCGHVNNLWCWQLDNPDAIQCRFPVSTTLDCGHAKDFVCWQLADPEFIQCTTRVSKALPGCEHTAVMECSTDSTNMHCLKQCGQSLGCCGRRCTSACNSCQRLNYVALPNGRMERRYHVPHPCRKVLYCQHECEVNCSDEHSCSGVPCTARCRQTCQHRACTKPCWLPCEPCMNPCIWKCPHHECPVVCSAPCARLPCDNRCGNQLKCGHQCPSVCGEPCNIQICPRCVTGPAKNQVVDMVTQITLAKINLHPKGLDGLLITLECKHIFTVKYLDAICELRQYYQNRSGQWIGLATPPAGPQRAPVCPLCQEPITSLRYGRIVKRADLDRSEQNVAKNGRRVLMALDTQLVSHRAKAEEPARLVEEAFKTKKVPRAKTKEKAKANSIDLTVKQRHVTLSISPTETLPIPSKFLGAGSSNVFDSSYGLPKSLVTAWKKAAGDLLTAYDAASKLAMFNSAHRQVYDASVAMLHQQIIPQIDIRGRTFGDRSTIRDQALAFARSLCGLAAPPKADILIQVEACWISFNIRFELIELARAVTSYIITLPKNEDARARWMAFIDYIYDSIERDAALVVQLADNSEFHRQAAMTVLRFMEAAYQRFSVRVTDQTNKAATQLLKAEAQRGYTKAKATLAERTWVYCNAMNGNLEGVQWLSHNFAKPATAIVDKWGALVQRSQQNTRITDAEKGEIMKTLGQWSRIEAPIGDFYQCPKGHVYVIGDYGNATNRSRCPECGVVIGESGL